MSRTALFLSFLGWIFFGYFAVRWLAGCGGSEFLVGIFPDAGDVPDAPPLLYPTAPAEAEASGPTTGEAGREPPADSGGFSVAPAADAGGDELAAPLDVTSPAPADASTCDQSSCISSCQVLLEHTCCRGPDPWSACGCRGTTSGVCQ
ncbi:MAG TPA: hypothetical protein VK989_13320 [Polyangia bacterium]|jgi:hypothetical protein|nr:hypothetical protein [Polyangia bacterium]